MQSYSVDVKSSIISLSPNNFDPQDYPTEISAIEKFTKTVTDLVASGDIKVVLAQFITKFLQQLDSVTALLKSKMGTRASMEHFKDIITKMVISDGLKLFEILKEVILVRQRDRSLREFCLRAVKRLFKIAGEPVAAMLA